MKKSPNLNQAPLDPATEQLIRSVVQAFLKPAERGECKCHWLDCNKTPILMWKSAKDPDTFVLKIAQQKFIGLTRADKKNEIYWKFKEAYELDPADNSPPPPNFPTPPEKSRPEVNLPNLEPPSNQVQLEKFRARYGTADSPKN